MIERQAARHLQQAPHLDTMAHPQDLSALETLLRDLFREPGELRRFVARLPGCGDLPQQLPGATASDDAVTFSVAEGLDARGLLDDQLFRLLGDARPGRVAAIDAVALRFTRRTIRRRALVLGALVVASLIAGSSVFVLTRRAPDEPIEAKSLPTTPLLDLPPTRLSGEPPVEVTDKPVEINYASKNQVQAGPNSKLEFVGIKGGR